MASAGHNPDHSPVCTHVRDGSGPVRGDLSPGGRCIEPPHPGRRRQARPLTLLGYSLRDTEHLDESNNCWVTLITNSRCIGKGNAKVRRRQARTLALLSNYALRRGTPGRNGPTILGLGFRVCNSSTPWNLGTDADFLGHLATAGPANPALVASP